MENRGEMLDTLLYLSPTYSLKAGSLMNLELGWQLVISNKLPSMSTAMPGFLVGTGDLNSVLYACLESTLTY